MLLQHYDADEAQTATRSSATPAGEVMDGTKATTAKSTHAASTPS
jgi:hypothetical protein